ncbi:hypothetical protein [Snuella lapsa]|uniref:Lipoprotein n=1 Tax=Snuella lapsa TaxID=870481 RepID=A0ABP6X5F5_9FLAO
MIKKRLHIILSALILVLSCGTPKTLISPKNFKFDVKGLFVKCKLLDNSFIKGELIEVTPETIRVLTNEKEENIKTFKKENINNVEIFVSSIYDNPKIINRWSTLMPVTSVGHGFFGIFSLPVNIGVAISMNSTSQSSSYRMKYPDNISWNEMSKFARFPQGIPNNIDMNQIE